MDTFIEKGTNKTEKCLSQTITKMLKVFIITYVPGQLKLKLFNLMPTYQVCIALLW